MTTALTPSRSTACHSSCGIERAVRQRHDRSLQQQRRHRAEPHPGAVHLRARGEPDGRRVELVAEREQLVDVGRRREARDRRAEAGDRDREDAVRVHHALRHAGRAARVEHVDVFGLTLDAGRGLVRSEHVVPPQRAVDVLTVDAWRHRRPRSPRAASRPSAAPSRHDRRGSSGSTGPRRRSCRAGTAARLRCSGS